MIQKHEVHTMSSLFPSQRIPKQDKQTVDLSAFAHAWQGHGSVVQEADAVCSHE